MFIILYDYISFFLHFKEKKYQILIVYYTFYFYIFIIILKFCVIYYLNFGTNI